MQQSRKTAHSVEYQPSRRRSEGRTNTQHPPHQNNSKAIQGKDDGAIPIRAVLQMVTHEARPFGIGRYET